MILVDAVYVHHSGVRILLDSLISSLEAANSEVAYLLDSRIQGIYDHLGEGKVHYIPGSAVDRYRFYRENQHRFRRVVCFSSVPPPIRIDGECIVYLQSTLLISLEGLTLKTFPSRFAHNIYMRLTKRNVDLWIVQTQHMLKLAKSFVGHSRIPVIPFFRDFTSTRTHKDNHIHLLYVSEGYPHKNHHRLFEAFEMAWNQQPNLVLHVTVSEAFASVITDLLRYRQRGVPIENHGFLPHDDVLALYGRVDAQIYPSMTEAFGIGLIESAQAGLPILAADRPYVHELVLPSVVFDPTNVGQMTDAMLDFSRSKTTTPSTLLIENQKNALLELILATPQKEY